MGAIAGAVVVLGRRTLLVDGSQPEIVKVVLFAVTLAVLIRFKTLPEPAVVLAAAVIGLALYPLCSRLIAGTKNMDWIVLVYKISRGPTAERLSIPRLEYA